MKAECRLRVFLPVRFFLAEASARLRRLSQAVMALSAAALLLAPTFGPGAPGRIRPLHGSTWPIYNRGSVVALDLDAAPTLPLTIESAPGVNDSMTWTPIFTTNSPRSPFQPTDYDASGAQRFYRGRQP